MAVNTRIDARAKNNNSIMLVDANGAILATIEVNPNRKEDIQIETLRNEANLRIQTSDKVTVVKGNGVVLRKK